MGSLSERLRRKKYGEEAAALEARRLDDEETKRITEEAERIRQKILGERASLIRELVSPLSGMVTSKLHELGEFRWGSGNYGIQGSFFPEPLGEPFGDILARWEVGQQTYKTFRKYGLFFGKPRWSSGYGEHIPHTVPLGARVDRGDDDIDYYEVLVRWDGKKSYFATGLSSFREDAKLRNDYLKIPGIKSHTDDIGEGGLEEMLLSLPQTTQHRIGTSWPSIPVSISNFREGG